MLDFLGIRRPSSRTSFLEAADRAERGLDGLLAADLQRGRAGRQIDADSGDLLRSLGYGD